MGTLLELIAAVLVPSGVGYAVLLGVGWRRWAAARRPPSPPQPIEQVGADLRRLHAELERTESAVGLPAKRLRCEAVRAAYVDILAQACARLDVPPLQSAAGAAVSLTEIYRAEQALRQLGMDVRASPAR
ncbi:MAG: hypothetical protein M3N95_05365 [Actinomycetota bacterium]|nr:hypothetical protein [Actinomycetota bacterium]